MFVRIIFSRTYETQYKCDKFSTGSTMLALLYLINKQAKSYVAYKRYKRKEKVPMCLGNATVVKHVRCQNQLSQA